MELDQELRKHSCKLGVDYERRLILCTPEDGKNSVVLTTPVLYAWHKHNLCTEEGIRHWKLLEGAGFGGKDLALKMLQGYKIAFVNCKEIYVYGMILSESKDEAIFAFDQNSTRKILGSPFLYRKTAFLSHSTVDKAIVRELASLVEYQVDVWLDEKSISAGDSITAKIDEGLSNCDAVILCLSENSVTSDWVRIEYAYALHNKIKIIPVRLDNCSPPPTLADIKYIDFPKDKAMCVREILKAIELASRGQPA